MTQEGEVAGTKPIHANTSTPKFPGSSRGDAPHQGWVMQNKDRSSGTRHIRGRFKRTSLQQQETL